MSISRDFVTTMLAGALCAAGIAVLAGAPQLAWLGFVLAALGRK